MVRFLFLALLLANLGFFVWSQGLLAPYGLAPRTGGEPERLARQIQPERVRLLTATDEARPPDAPATNHTGSNTTTTTAAASPPSNCQQAGLFDEAGARALRSALADWPEGSWRLDDGVEPARWMVYMGRYNDPDTLARKKAELGRRNVVFDTATPPEFQPGLSLGRFVTEANAQQALKQLEGRGVISARVVQERAEQRGQVLRLPELNDALRARLDGLKTALAGRALRPCN